MKHDSSWALRRVLKSLGRYLTLLIVSLVLAACAAAGAGAWVWARAGKVSAASTAVATQRRLENAAVMESVLSQGVKFSATTTVAAVEGSVRRPCIACVSRIEACVKL